MLKLSSQAVKGTGWCCVWTLEIKEKNSCSVKNLKCYSTSPTVEWTVSGFESLGSQLVYYFFQGEPMRTQYDAFLSPECQWQAEGAQPATGLMETVTPTDSRGAAAECDFLNHRHRYEKNTHTHTCTHNSWRGQNMSFFCTCANINQMSPCNLCTDLHQWQPCPHQNDNKFNLTLRNSKWLPLKYIIMIVNMQICVKRYKKN